LFDIVATLPKNTQSSYINIVVDMKTLMLRLRVEPEFKELLQKAVREGKAETMSELIRKAIFNFLSSKETIKNEHM